MDQQAALLWVHENIAKVCYPFIPVSKAERHVCEFGGNPDMVTIYGESAGAGSVQLQVIANYGNTQPPLFNAVIASSIFSPANAHNDYVVEVSYWCLGDGMRLHRLPGYIRPICLSSQL